MTEHRGFWRKLGDLILSLGEIWARREIERKGKRRKGRGPSVGVRPDDGLSDYVQGTRWSHSICRVGSDTFFWGPNGPAVYRGSTHSRAAKGRGMNEEDLGTLAKDGHLMEIVLGTGRKEARAEIERLREEVAGWKRVNIERGKKIGRLNAEIERLREERDYLIRQQRSARLRGGE